MRAHHRAPTRPFLNATGTDALQTDCFGAAWGQCRQWRLGRKGGHAEEQWEESWDATPAMVEDDGVYRLHWSRCPTSMEPADSAYVTIPAYAPGGPAVRATWESGHSKEDLSIAIVPQYFQGASILEHSLSAHVSQHRQLPQPANSLCSTCRVGEVRVRVRG